MAVRSQLFAQGCTFGEPKVRGCLRHARKRWRATGGAARQGKPGKCSPSCSASGHGTRITASEGIVRHYSLWLETQQCRVTPSCSSSAWWRDRPKPLAGLPARPWPGPRHRASSAPPPGSNGGDSAAPPPGSRAARNGFFTTSQAAFARRLSHPSASADRRPRARSTARATHRVGKALCVLVALCLGRRGPALGAAQHHHRPVRAAASSPNRNKFSSPTASRISTLAPSRVPMVSAPFHEHHFQPAIHGGIVVQQLGDAVDQPDDELGHVIARRRLAAEDTGPPTDAGARVLAQALAAARLSGSSQAGIMAATAAPVTSEFFQGRPSELLGGGGWIRAICRAVGRGRRGNPGRTSPARRRTCKGTTQPAQRRALDRRRHPRHR